MKRVRDRNITVRPGVSISDEASAQPFNFNASTRRRKHGIKQLAKMFGYTSRSTRKDVSACVRQ
jgi:hypothetical protein